VQISTGIDALKGLQQLQLLVLDVAALVRFCGSVRTLCSSQG
jgi:hypothetical protein